MSYVTKMKRTTALLICLCFTALFAISASAGLHSLFCINDNCRICALVHNDGGSSHENTSGGILPNSALLSALPLVFIFCILSDVIGYDENKTPVNLKVRLDI